MKGDEPAFPHYPHHGFNEPQALAGMMVNATIIPSEEPFGKRIAEWCYIFADAMIEHRTKGASK